MKKLFLSLILVALGATVTNAQTIVKGDMNDDGELNVSDVTMTVSTILGNTPIQTISLAGNPFEVDNTLVVGTWYAPDGTSFAFNEDGTTTFPGAFTYKFRPTQGVLTLYNASGNPIKAMVMNDVTSEYLLEVNYATGAFTYYTNEGSLATGITLSQTTLAMNSGTTAQMTANVMPEGSFGAITWTSSDESVATVDANGLVTAIAGGSATITATASGSLVSASCAVSVTQMVTSINLSMTKTVLGLNESVILTATVLPETASNRNVTWSSSNEDVAYVRNGKVVPFSCGTAIITCEAADGSGVKAICKVNVANTEYVDLNLPSGTLWAKCNIGATNPEDYGDYYAWGEIAGYNDGKTEFSLETYFDKDENGNPYKKYNNDGGLLELILEDDAAYMNWGPAWRMPSLEQFEELLNNEYTTTEWTTMNGIYGRKITSKTNENSIFFPAAGDYEGITFNYGGKRGLYWSRTLTLSGDYVAWFMGFYSNDISINNTYRESGLSVRPVRLSE
ncbi:MAG: Ig-like domain-containing protein [Bacteroidaceae bacterium]|nr:Ig-like domain-containing protein [Bacteroidaceae bacterium]